MVEHIAHNDAVVGSIPAKPSAKLYQNQRFSYN